MKYWVSAKSEKSDQGQIKEICFAQQYQGILLDLDTVGEISRKRFVYLSLPDRFLNMLKTRKNFAKSYIFS